MNQPTDEQVLRAARKMCALSSEACNVDFGDNWKIYCEAFLEEARIVLEAAFSEVNP